MDAIRALATILVVIVHTHGSFFNSDVHLAVFAFLNVIGTIGVPLFVILTGYLMFDRNYEDSTYLKKYLAKNLLPLVIAYEVWNIVWNILRYTHVAENPQKWSSVIKAALFMGDTYSALWYLPMAIALYLGMPILAIAYRKITSKLYPKILLGALILSGTLIPSVAPILSLFDHNTSIHSVLRMNIFGASVWGESVWMIYLLSGFAIYKGALKHFKTSLILILGTILPFTIMYAIKLNGYSVQHYSFILVVILSISTFELLTRTENLLQKHEKSRKLLIQLSNFSFAIYMLHIWIGGGICRLLKIVELNKPIGQSFPLLSSILVYIAFLIATIIAIRLIVYIVGKNKFIRQYVLLMK